MQPGASGAPVELGNSPGGTTPPPTEAAGTSAYGAEIHQYLPLRLCASREAISKRELPR